MSIQCYNLASFVETTCDLCFGQNNHWREEQGPVLGQARVGKARLQGEFWWMRKDWGGADEGCGVKRG